MEGQYLKNIKKGMKVKIITLRNRIATGIVEDIASRTEFHERGIMVRLKTGEVGRVEKIIIEKKSGTGAEEIIGKGETSVLEFKSSALWSLNYSEQEIRQSKSYNLHAFKQKASKVIIAKSIAAFLNSEGGNLIIGVKEKKDSKNEFEIIGIEEDINKLKSIGKDSSKDGYKRMIIDDIIRPYFPPKIYNHLNDYIIIGFIDVKDADNNDINKESKIKTLCNIKIRRSDVRVFLNLEGRKIFMIRTDTENRQIEDEQLVEYCMKKWRI